VAADETEPIVTTVVPVGVVRARRTTGALLLVSSLATVVAVVVAVGAWLTAPRQVVPITPGYGGSTTVQSFPTGSTATTLTAGEALAAHRTADAAAVAAVGDGSWVPQLASNRVGTDKTGRYWDEQAILDDHERWRAYGGVLLWSGDFKTYKNDDFWVTVVPSQAAGSADAVVAWCDQQNLSGDHCLAKRLSTTSEYAGDNTKNRR
jgi:hypothetical protein